MKAELLPSQPTGMSKNAPANEWETDPSRLSFCQYWDRCLWSAPDSGRVRTCLDPELADRLFYYTVVQKENEYANGEDTRSGIWTAAIDNGRSYLVGDRLPLAKFVRRHSSRLTGWQRLVYRWCIANPSVCLVLSSERMRRKYEIKKRGEYVEIALPHHDFGGERHWITRDGKTKVLVNVD